MLRNIIAAVLGLIVAWVMFMTIQALSHLAFPPPVALDLNNQASIDAFMANLSPLAFVVVLAGYAIGSFASGLVIGRIASSKKHLIPIIVGAILTLGWVMNLYMLPHPLWVAVVGFFMFIPFVVFGKNVTAGDASGAASDSEEEGEDKGDKEETGVEAGAGTGVSAGEGSEGIAGAGVSAGASEADPGSSEGDTGGDSGSDSGSD